MGSPPAGKGLGLVGGRFWALANDDDDLQNTPAASPTPSDIVCESILVGYSEEQVAESIDGFVPDSDPAWEELTANDEDRSRCSDGSFTGELQRTRKPRRPAAISRPTAHVSAKTDLGIREAKESRLNSILCQDGPESQPVDLRTPGYMAQSVVQIHQIPDSPGRTLSEIDVVTDVVTEGPLSGDSPLDYNERGARSGISGVSVRAILWFPSRSHDQRILRWLQWSCEQGVRLRCNEASVGLRWAIHLRQDLLLGYLLQWWLARGRIFSELRCLLVRGAALLVLEKVVLELIIAAAEVDSMDTEVMQIIATSLLVVQVVVGRIGTPEEVLGEEPINGIVPSSHPKAILWKELAALISGKEAGVEYATMVGTILSRYGRKSPKRTGRKMAPAHTK
ncbi:hypothetical protein ZWY2020_036392 [Hordeum vulgare]|nr:hypothetical protein ZWY2020_036392 [Hordeum vulgare]